MPGIDHLELSLHLDRIRRFVLSRRAGVTIHHVPRAWVSLDLTEPCGDVPSNNPNRLAWFALQSPPTAPEVKETLDALRALGRTRVFIWIGPAAWDARLHDELVRHGAHQWPYVEYPVLTRAVEDCPDTRPTDFEIRPIPLSEAPSVLAKLGDWYNRKGTQTALNAAQDDRFQLFAAFEGAAPIALAALIMDGPWAYLGWAGTDPAKRSRGAQTALIRSRMKQAAAHGARWLVSETVTADMTSTNNMKRCGFELAFGWRVYRWDDPLATKTAESSTPGNARPV